MHVGVYLRLTGSIPRLQIKVYKLSNGKTGGGAADFMIVLQPRNYGSHLEHFAPEAA
jgi:hypothetical protein